MERHRYLQRSLALLVACGVGWAAIPTDASDDFRREGKNRPAKDALEGKAPPALEVDGWINAPGGELTLESLRGKVVVLDFWGTW